MKYKILVTDEFDEWLEDESAKSRVQIAKNLSFGFIPLRISDLCAILPLFLLGNRAFGYSLRRNRGNF